MGLWNNQIILKNLQPQLCVCKFLGNDFSIVLECQKRRSLCFCRASSSPQGVGFGWLDRTRMDTVPFTGTTATFLPIVSHGLLSVDQSNQEIRSIINARTHLALIQSIYRWLLPQSICWSTRQTIWYTTKPKLKFARRDTRSQEITCTSIVTTLGTFTEDAESAAQSGPHLNIEERIQVHVDPNERIVLKGMNSPQKTRMSGLGSKHANSVTTQPALNPIGSPIHRLSRSLRKRIASTAIRGFQKISTTGHRTEKGKSSTQRALFVTGRNPINRIKPERRGTLRYDQFSPASIQGGRILRASLVFGYV